MHPVEHAVAAALSGRTEHVAAALAQQPARPGSCARNCRLVE
jgi:hypothetical protein